MTALRATIGVPIDLFGNTSAFHAPLGISQPHVVTTGCQHCDVLAERRQMDSATQITRRGGKQENGWIH